MPNRNLLPAVLTLIFYLSASSTPAALAGDQCLVKPNAPAPHGKHWYFRSDHVNKRRCWYLKSVGQSARKDVSQPNRQPARQAHAPPETSAQQPQAATSKAPAAPANADFPNQTAPVRWVETMDLSFLPRAAPTAPGALPPDGDAKSKASRAEARVPAGATGARRLPDAAVATDAVDTAPPADDHARLRSSRAVTKPPAAMPLESRATGSHVLALFMLLFAALAIAGPLLHYLERRRAREAANFRPPQWARVVALNAPTPRIRVPRPRAPKADVNRPSAALPHASSDHAEKLAQTLQQLADRLRAQPEQAPDPVSHRALRPPARDNAKQVQRTASTAPAKSFAIGGTVPIRASGAARKTSPTRPWSAPAESPLADDGHARQTTGDSVSAVAAADAIFDQYASKLRFVRHR